MKGFVSMQTIDNIDDLYIYVLQRFQDAEETIHTEGSSNPTDYYIYQGLGICVLALQYCNQSGLDRSVNIWVSAKTLKIIMDEIDNHIRMKLLPYDSYPDIRVEIACLKEVIEIQKAVLHQMQNLLDEVEVYE